ncbi:MAG: hypothetical protein HY681_08620 [Chloroflexi bacterium]|nr:hypothetical protein [Chloroflexota bacterium]
MQSFMLETSAVKTVEMTDAEIVADNAAQRNRLAEVIGRIEDFDVEFGGGWTIAAAVAHLAFWDRLYLMHLGNWPQDGPPSDDPSDSLNDVLIDEWLAVPPRQAVELALAAAQAIDKAIESLDERVADAILTHGSDWLLKRGRHRREHLDQIERALRA